MPVLKPFDIEDLRKIIAEQPHAEVDKLSDPKWVHSVSDAEMPRILARGTRALRRQVAVTSRSPSTLARLARESDYWIRDTVAENPHTSGKILAQLAKDSSTVIRRSVAENVSTPPDVLARLAWDPDEWTVVAVASHKRTPPEVLAKLLDHPSWRVVRNAKDNPNTPKPPPPPPSEPDSYASEPDSYASDSDAYDGDELIFTPSEKGCALGCLIMIVGAFLFYMGSMVFMILMGFIMTLLGP